MISRISIGDVAHRAKHDGVGSRLLEWAHTHNIKIRIEFGRGICSPAIPGRNCPFGCRVEINGPSILLEICERLETHETQSFLRPIRALMFGA